MEKENGGGDHVWLQRMRDSVATGHLALFVGFPSFENGKKNPEKPSVY